MNATATYTREDGTATSPRVRPLIPPAIGRVSELPYLPRCREGTATGSSGSRFSRKESSPPRCHPHSRWTTFGRPRSALASSRIHTGAVVKVAPAAGSGRVPCGRPQRHGEDDRSPRREQVGAGDGTAVAHGRIAWVVGAAGRSASRSAGAPPASPSPRAPRVTARRLTLLEAVQPVLVLPSWSGTSSPSRPCPPGRCLSGRPVRCSARRWQRGPLSIVQAFGRAASAKP
jgi:hypothetical protein